MLLHKHSIIILVVDRQCGHSLTLHAKNRFCVILDNCMQILHIVRFEFGVEFVVVAFDHYRARGVVLGQAL